MRCDAMRVLSLALSIGSQLLSRVPRSLIPTVRVRVFRLIIIHVWCVCVCAVPPGWHTIDLSPCPLLRRSILTPRSSIPSPNCFPSSQAASWISQSIEAPTFPFRYYIQYIHLTACIFLHLDLDLDRHHETASPVPDPRPAQRYNPTT